MNNDMEIAWTIDIPYIFFKEIPDGYIDMY